VSSLFAAFRLSEVLWEAEHTAAGDASDAHRGVIVGGSGPAGTVAAASPDVRRSGVVAGMRTADARRCCPRARVRPGSLSRLLEVVSTIQTAVGRTLPETVWFDIGCGLAITNRLGPGDLQRTLDRLRSEVESAVGVSLACGLASSRLAAEIAARLVAPSGLLYVLPGYETRVLAPVGLRWLDGVDTSLLARCEAHGWQTIGDLARLEAGEARALGGVGAVLSRLARGEDPRPEPRPELPRRLTICVDPGLDAAGPSEASATVDPRWDALVHGIEALLKHPQRDARDVMAVRVVTCSDPDTQRRWELRPPRGHGWNRSADILTALSALRRDAIADGIPLPGRAFVSLQLEAPGPRTIQPASRWARTPGSSITSSRLDRRQRNQRRSA
jgi:nucleotidyltransferase/DNA polymerase involved in DNA repair